MKGDDVTVSGMQLPKRTDRYNMYHIQHICCSVNNIYVVVLYDIYHIHMCIHLRCQLKESSDFLSRSS